MKGQAIYYSDEQLAYIERNSKLPRKQLTAMFNELFGKEINQKNIESLCKRNGWLTGRTGQFKKGQPKPPGSGAKTANKTSFKKGNRPHNWKPVGSKRLTKDGYIEIKTKEPKTFELQHRVIWEQEHGTIQPGMIIRFKDNNPMNCHINNLEQISRYEHMCLNKMHYAQEKKELQPTIKLIAQLETKSYDCRN